MTDPRGRGSRSPVPKRKDNLCGGNIDRPPLLLALLLELVLRKRNVAGTPTFWKAGRIWFWDKSWAVTFIPMPMPKTVGITNLYNTIVQLCITIGTLILCIRTILYIIVQLEACITSSGRGMGMNVTAQN